VIGVGPDWRVGLGLGVGVACCSGCVCVGALGVLGVFAVEGVCVGFAGGGFCFHFLMVATLPRM
jgi:hypothetical protein